MGGVFIMFRCLKHCRFFQAERSGLVKYKQIVRSEHQNQNPIDAIFDEIFLI